MTPMKKSLIQFAITKCKIYANTYRKAIINKFNKIMKNQVIFPRNNIQLFGRIQFIGFSGLLFQAF